MARVKQVALKNLDAALKAALDSVNRTNKLKLKPPLINGIVIRPEALGQFKPEAIAKQIAAEVAPAVKDMKLTPKVFKADGFITVGYIMEEIPVVAGPNG